MHRFTLDGRQLTRTLATTLNPLFSNLYVSAAVTTDGGREVLAVATTTAVDIDGDGTCTRPASAGALTLLDATTLAPVRTLTRAQLGGREVLSVAAQPLPPGDAGTPAVYVLARTAPRTSPALMRYAGVPTGAPPVWSADVLALARPLNLGCQFAQSMPLAVEPGGTTIVDFLCAITGDARGGGRQHGLT